MAVHNLRLELAEAAQHWNYIEKRLKEAEQISLDVVTPAINELRYAGRQIVDALAIFTANPPSGSVEWENCENHITVARQYLVNADHDITDAVGLWLNVRLTRAIEDFGFKFLEKHIPQFEEKDMKLRELQGIIATSREQRQFRSTEYRRAAVELIPDLLKMFNQITMAEEIAIARDRKMKYFNITCLIVGFVGSVASIVSIFTVWDQVKALFRF